MSFKRSVSKAVDEISGVTVDADKLFNRDRETHIKYREAYNKSDFVPKCVACRQYLSVKSSSNDRVFFSHMPNSDYCELKDENLSKSEKKKTEEIFASKESPEHKYLKNKIGKLLMKTNGIDKNSIQIDDQYLFDDHSKKRKPDVYCKYKDKYLAFEIQLSPLTQRYIIDRTNFYRGKGIYLIWVLENFDFRKQSKMKKDLKYATPHENFFKLDKNFSEELKLNCKFKVVLNVTNDLVVIKKWREKSISLDQLNFKELNYQCFFYDISKAEVKSKAEKIRLEIKEKRKKEYSDYNSIHKKIYALDSEEIDILNDHLKLQQRTTQSGKPVLNHYIFKANEPSFIQFLLGCEVLHLKVNEMDDHGVTAFQEILYNNNLTFGIKKRLFKYLFRRGYEFKESDRKVISEVITNEHDTEKLITLCNLSSKSPPRIVHMIFEDETLFYILESIRKNRIIGFNYKPEVNPGHWVAFANNAIDNYSKHWLYIEAAFKAYGLWKDILELDKKDSFKRKLIDFYSKDLNPETPNGNIGFLYHEAQKELNWPLYESPRS